MRYGLLVLTLLVSLTAGCDFLLTDIKGWDLTACGSSEGFWVCYELFNDNQEQILGGQTAVEATMDWLTGDDEETNDN